MLWLRSILILFTYLYLRLSNRTLDKILFIIDRYDMPLYLSQSVLLPFLQMGTMIDSFPSAGNFSLFQIELISLWVTGRIVFSPCFNQFYWDLISTPDLWLFSFSIAISTSKALRSGTSGSAVCISVCLTSLTPCTFSSWEKCFHYLTLILWRVSNQITLLIL
jgi:hypothetical protein